MAQIANLAFSRALGRKEQHVPPIWFMRQAGRYHSHYQKLRAKHSFMELCKEPELAAEVALGPILDFDFDVSILFSDLLFPLEALGMELFYDPGPKFREVLTPKMLESFRSTAEAIPELMFQKRAAQITRELLPKNKSLIGFVGGPWTLFNYALSGGHDGHLISGKTNLPFFHKFCEKMVPLLIENIKLQFDGGAEVVMIFDTAAGELSPDVYQNEVYPHTRALADAYPQRLGFYTKGTQISHFRQVMSAESPWAGFGADHRFEISELLKMNKNGFVQGNFDQALLFADGLEFDRLLRRYLEPLLKMSPEQRQGWVCGLGHGILPNTPEKNVRRFISTVRETF